MDIPEQPLISRKVIALQRLNTKTTQLDASSNTTAETDNPSTRSAAIWARTNGYSQTADHGESTIAIRCPVRLVTEVYW